MQPAWTKGMLTDPVYHKTNIHPNWRALHLSSMMQVRQMIRDGRYVAEGTRILRGYQRDALATRRKLAAARAAA